MTAGVKVIEASHTTTVDQARRNLTLLGAACALTSSAAVLSTQQVGGKAKPDPNFQLDRLIPKQFGGWEVMPAPVQAVNPQTQAIIDKLYSQVLERTYAHQSGYQIMLAMAYGADQRGNLETHMPDVCYPAQGFKVLSKDVQSLQTPAGVITATRLVTQRESRHEPLMYWFTVGESNVKSRIDKRLAELRMAVTGQIPDGLLIRVSSIDLDVPRALAWQSRFVQELISTLGPDMRRRMAVEVQR
jgi:EpsI family protein